MIISVIVLYTECKMSSLGRRLPADEIRPKEGWRSTGADKAGRLKGKHPGTLVLQNTLTRTEKIINNSASLHGLSTGWWSALSHSLPDPACVFVELFMEEGWTKTRHYACCRGLWTWHRLTQLQLRCTDWKHLAAPSERVQSRVYGVHPARF